MDKIKSAIIEYGRGTQKELLMEILSALPLPHIFNGPLAKSFLDDANVVNRALCEDVVSYDTIPAHLWQDTTFVKDLLAINSSHIEYVIKVNPKVTDNEDIILIVSQSYGSWLHYTSDRIKNDRALVLNILRNGAIDLDLKNTPQYADDEEVILTLNYPYVEFASERLRKDKDFMMAVIAKYDVNLCFALCNLPIELIMDVAKKHPNRIMNMAHTELLVKILAADGLMLEHLPKHKHTASLVGTAVSQNKAAIEFV